MNIVYIDKKVHTGTSKIYKYYDGLFDALAKQENCFLWSHGIKDIKEVLTACPFKPDVFVFGLGWHQFNKIKGLPESNIPSMFFMFKPQNQLENKQRFCVENKVNMIVSSIPSYIGCKFENIPCKRVCYAADPDVFKNRKIEKIYDVGFSGALHNNNQYIKGAFNTVDIREKMQKIIAKMPIKSFLNGSDLVAPRIKSYDKYAHKINQCKMWFATPAAFSDITPRYFEIPMSGTLLMCSEVPEVYKDIFRDGETCVEFKNDLGDFSDKVIYYLEHWEESQNIINLAEKEFHENHTWEERAKQFVSMIKEL